jgi:exopolysaccharide biosynthesis polyprenyl glycosylphosphotransferase
MNEAKRKLVGGAMKLFDLFAASLALAFAAVLMTGTRGRVPLRGVMSLQIRVSHALLYILLLLIWHGLFSMCGMYESKRLTAKLDLVRELFLATTLATASLTIIEWAADIRSMSLTFIELFWLCSALILLGSRLLIYYLLRRIRTSGRDLRHILILGTNARAREFAGRIQSKPELGYRLVGFVDRVWAGMPGLAEQDREICCDFAGLEAFLRWHVVDEIAMYLPLRSFYECSADIATLCEEHGITLRLAPDLFNLKVARSRSDELDGEPQITEVTGVVAGGWLILKRFLDFALSFTLLIVLSPILVLLASLVKLSSRGPILFQQKRLGRHRRQFVMFKFRTMIDSAEKLQNDFAGLNEMSGPVFKIKNDPRITPLGRILRKASLDELPQLWNVLRGEMSLVGPRAMSVRDYGLFPQDWQRRRFSVQPGITCLWQVNGRNSIGFDAWMEMDMEYIDRWSFWLDLKILARTVPAVIKGVGAG